MEDSLVNSGTGRNYGVELTIEKFFSDGYYGLFTSSLYDSKYTASDGVERNTAFNGKYVLNILFGKEWKVGSEEINNLTRTLKSRMPEDGIIHLLICKHLKLLAMSS